MKRYYPIGTPGQAWGIAEKQLWRSQQPPPQRSYHEAVLQRLEALKARFTVQQYGCLDSPIYFNDNNNNNTSSSSSTEQQPRYPLFALFSSLWKAEHPTVLVTGGVHGYETSGVLGAMHFLESGEATRFEQFFNVIVVPCVSPWAFETINRMNPDTYDVNRFWHPNSPAMECASLMAFLEKLLTEKKVMQQPSQGENEKKNVSMTLLAHFDLHETTDTDATEFMLAKAAHAGKPTFEPCLIPDGFYLMASMHDPQLAWHQAMIEAVRKVTHIAPPDANNTIVDLPVISDGILHELGAPDNICSGYLTGTIFATTTEVYPDSKQPGTTPESCALAQSTCISAGLQYLVDHPEYVAEHTRIQLEALAKL